MDLNLIQTFLVVAEFQSYTKAAEHLGLTQPAVSASVKRLEQVVNKQLFVKKGRGIALTSTAYQLIPQFQQAISIIDNAVFEEKAFEVYCSEAILHKLDSLNGAVFHESPPDKYQLFEQLRRQKMDLVIDTVITKDAAFIVEEAYQEPAVVICRGQHPRIQGSIAKQEFYNETHCLFSGRWQDATGFEQLAKEAVQERKTEIVTCSLAGMAMNVAQHDCIGIISQSFATKWSKILDLQVLECPVEIYEIPYKLVYHKREIHNPAHMKLRESIKMQLNNFNSVPLTL